jgi:hypothetical protein
MTARPYRSLRRSSDACAARVVSLAGQDLQDIGGEDAADPDDDGQDVQELG